MKNSTTVFLRQTQIGTVNSTNKEACRRLFQQRFASGGAKNLPLLQRVRFDAAHSCIECCKEPDGSVWGVRYFRAVRPGFLMSPTSLYVWESHEAVADDFSNSAAVRGHVGFHAAWVEDLKTWAQSTVDHQQCEVKALVRGFGDVVLGDEGWRSSKLRIVQAVLNHSGLMLRDALDKRYPSIEFGEGWFGNNDAVFAVLPEFERFYSLRDLYKYVEANELMEEYK